MRIDKLEITNFKNFEHLEIEFAAGVNLFVGSNGSGKTSLLEAVNVALGGFFGEQPKRLQRTIELKEVHIAMDGKNAKRANKTSVSAWSENPKGNWTRNFNTISNNNDIKFSKVASRHGSMMLEQFTETDNKTIAPLIAYYSTQRLFKDASMSKEQTYDVLKGRLNGYLQCLSENQIKGTLVEWLRNAVTRRATLHIKDIEKTDFILENVESAVKFSLKLFVEEIDTEKIKIYQDPDFDFDLFLQLNEDFALPLSYYSDGFRNLLYLVIDLVWRATQLNPWLTLQEIATQVTGCVTIDEIDLHLHPKWQAKAIGLLQDLFPNVQFFITTHSPTVVANFEQRIDQIGNNTDILFILEKNDQITKVSDSYYGKDINSVLKNPMDANIRPKEIVDKIKEFENIAENDDATDNDYARLRQIAVEINDLLPGTDEKVIFMNSIIENLNAPTL